MTLQKIVSKRQQLGTSTQDTRIADYLRAIAEGKFLKEEAQSMELQSKYINQSRYRCI